MKFLITNNKSIFKILSDILDVPFNTNLNTYLNKSYSIMYVPNSAFKININSSGKELITIKNKYGTYIFTLHYQKNYLNKITYILNNNSISEIINCCDSTPRGQLTFNLINSIIEFQKFNLKIKRIWLTDYTENTILEALCNLKNNKKFNNLSNRLLAELIIDEYWRYFTNKLFNININYKELFLLKLVHDKEKLIKKHNISRYYKINIQVENYKGTLYNKLNKDRIYNRKSLNSILNKINSKPIYILNTSENLINKPHPLLFNLNDLLQEIKRNIKITMEDSMKVLNNLYEHGYITNPNTASRHLPAQYSNLQSIIKALNKLPQYRKYIDYIKSYEEITITNRVLNSKYTDTTHAIIPTNKIPISLSFDTKEYLVYDIIVRRFLCVFMKKNITKRIKIVGEFDSDNQVKFEFTKEIHKGWKIIYETNTDIYEYMKNMTTTKNTKITCYPGQEISDYKIKIFNNNTRNPNRYKIPALISLMETNGKVIKNDYKKLSSRLIGIGIPEERGTIIQTSIKKDILTYNENETVTIGKLGKKIVNNLPSNIFSLNLSVIISKQLSNILKNHYDIKSIIEDHINYIDTLLYEKPINHNSNNSVTNYDDIVVKYKCPLCKCNLVEKKEFIGCTNYPKCNLIIPKKIKGYYLKEIDFNELLTQKITHKITGFNFKNTPLGKGKSKLMINENGKTIFKFK